MLLSEKHNNFILSGEVNLTSLLLQSMGFFGTLDLDGADILSLEMRSTASFGMLAPGGLQSLARKLDRKWGIRYCLLGTQSIAGACCVIHLVWIADGNMDNNCMCAYTGARQSLRNIDITRATLGKKQTRAGQ